MASILQKPDKGGKLTNLNCPPAGAHSTNGVLFPRRNTTIAVVECTNAKTKVWDQRLSAAYKALGQVIDPAQHKPLKAAQRLWIQYRDANCGFYGSHDGTIRQVLGAECICSITEDRALEPEQAA